jgi:hypothetical protein
VLEVLVFGASIGDMHASGLRAWSGCCGKQLRLASGITLTILRLTLLRDFVEQHFISRI